MNFKKFDYDNNKNHVRKPKNFRTNPKPKIMTATGIKNDLQILCDLFKIGTLISWRSEKHTVEGYMVAKFETETGTYNYFFKS